MSWCIKNAWLLFHLPPSSFFKKNITVSSNFSIVGPTNQIHLWTHNSLYIWLLVIAFICFEELNFHENKAIYNSLLLQNKSRYMNAFELIIRFVSSNTVMTYDRNFVTYQRSNWTRLNEWRHRTIMIGLFFKYFLFYQTSSAH